MAGNVLVRVKMLKQEAHLMIIKQANMYLKPYKQDHSDTYFPHVF